MRKILAIAALAGGLMIPATTTTADPWGGGLPCENASLQSAQCGMDYSGDLMMCDIENPGGGGAWASCVSNANWRYDICMNSC